MEDVTRKFTAMDSKTEMREILSSVYNSLKIKGYNPIKICRIDRDELLQELLRTYLDK